MERDTFLRTVAAVVLPVAAIIGADCSRGNKNVVPTATQASKEAPVQITTDDELIDQIVEKFGGAVDVAITGYSKDADIALKFERIDIEKDEKRSVDDDLQYLTPAQADSVGGPIYSLFAATSCEGLYSLSISLDGGKNFNMLPVPDIVTRVPSTTFELPKDKCIRQIAIDLKSTQPTT